MLRLSLHAAPPVAPQSERAMFRTIRAAFSQRRKTAANAVSAGLGLPKAQVAAALQAVGAPPSARPEQLGLEQYAALSGLLLPAE